MKGLYLFSGVTCPKFALMMAALDPVVKRPWSVAVPKYFLPLAFMAASMLWAACREKRGSEEGRADAKEATESMVMRSNFMVMFGR